MITNKTLFLEVSLSDIKIMTLAFLQLHFSLSIHIHSL